MPKQSHNTSLQKNKFKKALQGEVAKIPAQSAASAW